MLNINILMALTNHDFNFYKIIFLLFADVAKEAHYICSREWVSLINTCTQMYLRTTKHQANKNSNVKPQPTEQSVTQVVLWHQLVIK